MEQVFGKNYRMGKAIKRLGKELLYEGMVLKYCDGMRDGLVNDDHYLRIEKIGTADSNDIFFYTKRHSGGMTHGGCAIENLFHCYGDRGYFHMIGEHENL